MKQDETRLLQEHMRQCVVRHLARKKGMTRTILISLPDDKPILCVGKDKNGKLTTKRFNNKKELIKYCGKRK